MKAGAVLTNYRFCGDGYWEALDVQAQSSEEEGEELIDVSQDRRTGCTLAAFKASRIYAPFSYPEP